MFYLDFLLFREFVFKDLLVSFSIAKPTIIYERFLNGTRKVDSDEFGLWFIKTTQTRAIKPSSGSLPPAPSPIYLGPRSSPSPRRGHHSHHHVRAKPHVVTPAPSKDPGCDQICVEPLTASPFGSPCGCVFPMKVRLLLDIAPYAIFPVMSELEIEVAEGTYLAQSQVKIMGASADSQNQGRNRIASSPPYEYFKGNGPAGSAGDLPITADFPSKNQRMNIRTIVIIAVSAFVLLLVLIGAIWIFVKWKRVGRPSSAVGPAFTSSVHKRSVINLKRNHYQIKVGPNKMTKSGHILSWEYEPLTKLRANGVGTVCGRLFVGTAEKVPPSELQDTTGAGDSFIGAVLYGIYLLQHAARENAAFAAQVAATCCRAFGARTGLPHRTDARLASFLY
ncbi:Protein kinase superfamily protein [Prunus dulcis]|uniref:Protein kinase superfamily protein n=1 Tax=Prunus dulcis TaxID=3755 RepID=A0A4Y1S0K5_PRUDU|nr:Protein kinase superfamily protein [Prunus dulcis]